MIRNSERCDTRGSSAESITQAVYRSQNMMAFSLPRKLSGSYGACVFNYSYRSLPNRGLIFNRNSKKKEKATDVKEYDTANIEADNDSYSVDSSQMPESKDKRLYVQQLQFFLYSCHCCNCYKH